MSGSGDQRASAADAANKYERLAELLRQRIVSGAWPPGHRLPTRAQLQREHQVACSTVQQALDLLDREGFVEAQGRRGTFVRLAPPHLTHVAIVFATEQNYPSQFHRALGYEADHLLHQGKRVSVFHGIDAHSDVEDYQHLLGLIRSRQLAGIVFAARIGELAEFSFLDLPDLPVVAIASASSNPALPVVFPDYFSFIDRALHHIKQAGKRRVAWIQAGTRDGAVGRYQEMFRAGVARHGLDSRPYWNHIVSPDAAFGARSLTHLLMHAEQTVRPDAIVIEDDNLVEPVTGGVMDAAARVPHDVLVVAHTNYPWPTPAHVPVVRLGFDVRQVLTTCVGLLDAQRQGQAVAPTTLLPALLENESMTPSV